MRGRGVATVVVIAALALLVIAAPAGAKTHWLCKPGTNASFCAPSLSTTTVSPTGATLGVQNIKRDKDPKYDCFYVYPTVSDQKTQTATFAIDPEEKSIVLYQASRYTQHCRLFAPVYRELTLQGIGFGGGSASNTPPPPFVYTDVRDAWRDYLKNFNDGRPVVLIGQSQGAIVLRRLVSQEIDRKPKARALLISALLMGGNVLVPQGGKDVGGDFQHVPACRAPSQIGCVVAFSTFGEPPPPTAIFGRTTQPGDEVLCTDPAALAGGSAPLTPVFPSAPFAPGTTLGAASQLIGIPRPDVSTTWISAPNSYDSTCQDADSADVMLVRPLNGAPVPHPVPDANWGLHLTDANIALGNNVALVQRQFRAWERKNAAK